MDRPGLDGDAEIEALIAIYREGALELSRELERVFERIRRELRNVGSLNHRRIVRRLRIEAQRLGDLQAIAEGMAADYAAGTRTWINEGGADRVYVAGAVASSLPFTLSPAHRAAIQVLAQDLFDDVLVATDFIESEAKDWVRRVSREMTGFKLTSGETARGQARKLERVLREEFGRNGIGKIIYSNGARHNIGEYAEMLVRTKTGVMYNTGTLNTGRQAGVEIYELLDGSECGLTSHRDPQRANGLLVDYQTAMSYPLSHPNCVRSVAPRPDLSSTADPFVSVQSDSSRADQTAFEQSLAQQQQDRVGRRQRRSRRARR